MNEKLTFLHNPLHLSAAFDKKRSDVSADNTLQKLESDEAFVLSHSHLKGRTVSVMIDNFFFDRKQVAKGVAQGFILGPFWSTASSTFESIYTLSALAVFMN